MRADFEILEGDGMWINVRTDRSHLEMASHHGLYFFILPRLRRSKSITEEGSTWCSEYRISWLSGMIRLRRVTNKPYPQQTHAQETN